MYVRKGSLHGFGAPSADEITNALVSCASAGNPLTSGGAESIANCLWSQLLDLILSSPEAQATLQIAATSDCQTVMNLLGIPEEAAFGICLLGGPIWTKIQIRAQRELGKSASQLYADQFARGRERSASEGGGHTLVNEDGSTVGILCPGIAVPITDSSGTIVGYSAPLEYRVGPDTPCTIGAATPTTPLVARYRREVYRMPVAPTTPEGEPEGEPVVQLTEETPWYKSPVVIGLGVVAGLGTIYVIYRATR